MLSRLSESGLFRNTGALGTSSANEGITKLLDLLSNDDKSMLSNLYALTQNKNEDISKLDNLALMIGSYRSIGRLL